MATKQQFRNCAELSATNVIRHGDTDVFPFPFENYAFFDRSRELINLITEYDDNFDDHLARYSPFNITALVPVTYNGFRWATQLDPIWNAHFLACVLCLAPQIEAARPPTADSIVYSYRFCPNLETGDLFDREYGWVQFMTRSLQLSHEHGYVIACDISEFYPRLGHHRIEAALNQIAKGDQYVRKILKFLSNYSNTRSYGLPIGGPAARLLSELTINQIDRLLMGRGIRFVRFADDYHLFAKSREEAYHHLFFLSEKLFLNQGLSLQKSKTRIMAAAEFRATSPIRDPGAGPIDFFGTARESAPPLLRFSLRFDPYSPTADADYERLRAEVKRFDIIGLLKDELAKSHVHVALARKIVSAIRFLEPDIKNDAVLSILENCEILYPIFSSVLWMIDQIYDELSGEV